MSDNLSLPQNIDMEIPLLGTLMLAEKSIENVCGLLHPDAFYSPVHNAIYKAMLSLYKQMQPTDVTSVSARLADLNQLVRIGGKEALIKIQEMTPHGVDVEAYAKEIQRYYVMRQLIKLGQDVSKRSHDTSKPLEELLQGIEQDVFAVTQLRNDMRGFVSPADRMFDIFLEIEQRSQMGLPPGTPTGFYELDAVTQGLKNGRAYYLIGRPGSGKTSFGLQAAYHIASKYDLTVAFFSLEMPTDELIIRLLAAESGIQSSRLEGGRVQQEDWEGLATASSKLQAIGNLKIDDTASLSIEEIASRCRRLQSETGNLGAVFIDHIQLLNYGRMREYEALSHITKQIKILAKELNIPIVPLCQLNRGVEDRNDKRPQMSDIRGSGTAEQDADVIIGFYRDDYYNPESVDRGIAEVLILKNRGGPTGTVKLLFDAPLTRFRNFSGRTGGDVVAPLPRRTPPQARNQAVDQALEDAFVEF